MIYQVLNANRDVVATFKTLKHAQAMVYARPRHGLFIRVTV